MLGGTNDFAHSIYHEK